MHVRTVVSPDQGTHSVVRIGTLWHVAVLAVAMFSGPLVAGDRTCAGSRQLIIDAVDLDVCRPAPVGAGEKAILLKSLPSEGEITQLTARERRKLKQLDSVLRIHGREEVYELKVMAVPQAWTGLHGRAVLLISLPALRLLNSEELQAVVAHEVRAQMRNDIARVRELELACDAVAILTLVRLGIKPDRLVTAIEKELRFNYDRFGLPKNENSYPPLKLRRELVKTMSGISR